MTVDSGLPAGTRLGPYLVEDQIGRGGMAVVYRGRHVRLQRIVALKVLLGYASTDLGLLRFQREAQTVARLRHPHILAIFDFGEEAGLPYMVTEFMPNGSLARQKRGRVLPPEDALGLLRPLAEAIDYAHGQGVIHRDVKPANVFLDARWRPILADFGISKLSSEDSLTATGSVTGTPAYMSPEQVRGGQLTEAADVYALAAMAYELLCGRPPFTGPDPWQVMYGHVSLPADPPSGLQPGLSTQMDEVVLAGLAKNPAHRWQSCVAMIEAMEAARGGRRIAPPVPSAPPALAGHRLRKRRLLLGGTVAALMLVAATGLAQSGGTVRTPTAPGQPTGAAGAGSRSGDGPSPGAARVLRVENTQPVRVGGQVSLHGSGLDPARRAVAGFLQGSDGIYPMADRLEVSADGSFRLTGRVPSGLQPGSAVLVACNLADDGSFTPGQDCARATVQVGS